MIDKDKLFEKAKNAIKDNPDFHFIEDVVVACGCSKCTFYDKFPLDSNEMNEIKELLAENCIKLKVDMRKKWRNSDNATLQMGLYKLVGTNEERRRLTTTHNQMTGDDGHPIQIQNNPAEHVIVFKNMDEKDYSDE